MRATLNRNDAQATILVFAAGLVYGLWTSEAALTGWSTRVIAIIVLGLGYAACVSDGEEMAKLYQRAGTRRHSSLIYVVIASLLGAIALTTAFGAVIDADDLALSIAMVSIVMLWGVTTLRHAFFRQPRLTKSPSDRSASPRQPVASHRG
jgi:hypothetical protein